MKKDLIAHVRQIENEKWDEPHLLIDHLKCTAEKAAYFAKKFNSQNWGYAAGIFHDFGKATDEWQNYIREKSGYEAHLETKSGKIEHSIQGAKKAEEKVGKQLGRVLSYCISGHHAGIPDWYESENEPRKSLRYRLNKKIIIDLPGCIEELSQSLPLLGLPFKFSDGFEISFWIRMLYSCLVDADYLDTENYMDTHLPKNRGGYLSIADLLSRFSEFISKKVQTSVLSSVNQMRNGVLDDCRKTALNNKGVFSLTVPTGGGKTLSSLAFALQHCHTNKMERIIYVIPFTSIIEQNSAVFKDVLGDDQVIEHHSNISPDDVSVKARLSSENWDAPVIVTTSVQFFESLFSSKPSRTRKLHNICNSVIILDEAQLIPVEYLEPILKTLDILVKNYGVSIVISTATQPALGKRDGFKGLTAPITEIVSDVKMLFENFKRVDIITDDCLLEKSWETISDELKGYDQLLCVVSDRKSCRELYHHMPTGTIHLSALMCGQHRKDVITQIKEKLNNKEMIRVISTQLIEAGVDLDFPVVYRAIAGLDSIAQAAGRCNREGRMDELGKVVVFTPPRRPPVGILRWATQTTEIMLKAGIADPLNPNSFELFFKNLYWKGNLDKEKICELLKADEQELAIAFRTASAKFKIIDDAVQKTILVPYGEGKELIELLKRKGSERWLLRKLQRYSVNVFTSDFAILLNRGSLIEVSDGIFAIMNDIDYDMQIGLLVNDNPSNSEMFIM